MALNALNWPLVICVTTILRSSTILTTEPPTGTSAAATIVPRCLRRRLLAWPERPWPPRSSSPQAASSGAAAPATPSIAPVRSTVRRPCWPVVGLDGRGPSARPGRARSSSLPLGSNEPMPVGAVTSLWRGSPGLDAGDAVDFLRAARLRGAPAVAVLGSTPSTRPRNTPVWLAGSAATCSGVPVATMVPPPPPPSGPRSTTQSARLDHVEVVLDHDHRVARRRPGGRARPAAWPRRRSAGRSSARRARRRCGRWSVAAARTRA